MSMEKEEDVNVDSSPREEAAPVEEAVSEDVETPANDAPAEEAKSKEKVVPYARFQEVLDQLNKYKKQPAPKAQPAVDALDFIKLGKKLQDYSDEEIDFATAYAKSKSPEAILEALGNDMVQLAISAKRQKVEKEKSLKPSGNQPEDDRPISLDEALRTASSDEEREKLLKEHMNYDIGPRRRGDSVGIQK